MTRILWADADVSEMDVEDLRRYADALRRLAGGFSLRYRETRKRLVEVEQEVERR